MSYARFGWDNSDVYVYLSDSGLECAMCLLQDREWRTDQTKPFGGVFHDVGPSIPHTFWTTVEMVEHLKVHQQAGHTVPTYCFIELLADARENDTFLERCRSRKE